MIVSISDNKITLGHEASISGGHHIRKAIREQGYANVAFVTGTSQIQTLSYLAKSDRIDWSKVNKNAYLEHSISSDADKVEETVRTLNETLKSHPLDVAFICIGENGHLAFNDPPANFDTKDPYIVVELETRSRRQQASEGWFDSINDVPKKAITMSVHEILSAKHIICSCPDQRKAKAVASCIFDDITPLSPCAALRISPDARLYLDRQSSKLVFADGRKSL